MNRKLWFFMFFYCSFVFFLVFLINFFELDESGLFYRITSFAFLSIIPVFPVTVVSGIITFVYKFTLIHDPVYKWVARDYPIFKFFIWNDVLPSNEN